MFDVFVSYAHEDAGLAAALASGLGRVGKPWWRRRSLRVFRDANVMTASADLWDSIRGPLEESRWFVAVISPAAAGSPWVAREIAWWVENRGTNQLLIVQAEGACSWDTERNDWADEATAVPAPLRAAFESEPHPVDATWTGGIADLHRRDGRFLDLLAEIAAPVEDTTKDVIVGEELRQRRRTVRTAVGAAALLLVLTIAAVIGALIALDQRDKAESRRQQALSQSLAGQATELSGRRPDLGIQLAVEAWRHAHTSQAEQALITAAQSGLPAAEHFRAPDNDAWVLDLVSEGEHGYALAGRLDGSLITWRLPSAVQGETVPKSPPTPHKASIAGLARDATGQRLVSVDVDGLVAVWDAATLAAPTTFTIPTGGEIVLDADLTANGEVLMVSTAAGIQLWDVDGQAQLGSNLVASNATVTHAALSPDGSRVGATLLGNDTTSAIEIWNVADGTAKRSALPAPDLFVDVSFTNDGLYFGTLSALGGSAAYRVSDGVIVAFLTPEGGVTTLTGGPLGGMVPASDHLFISANGSTNTLVWNAATNQALGTYALVLGGSPSAIAGSGNAIVASDVAGTMSWVPFAIASSDSLARPAGQVHAGSRFGTSAAPNTLLASVGNQFTVWDVEAQHAIGTFTATRADKAVPMFTALDSRARQVALGYADGTVELRDARTGAVTVEKPHLVTGNPEVSFAGDAVVVSTDSTVNPAQLVVVSPSGSVRHLWHAPTERRISAFAASGESVAVGLDDGRLVVWDSIANGRHRALDLGAIPAWRIAFADTGTRLVVGDGGGRLHVVDRSGAALRQVRDPITTDHGPVLQVGFSDANRVIAVSPILVSYSDLATGNMLAANVAPTHWSSLVIVPHGFITVDPTGALQRWRLDPQFLLSKLCSEVKAGRAAPALGSYLAGAAASTACPAAS